MNEQELFEAWLEYTRCQYLIAGFEKGVSIGKKALDSTHRYLMEP